MYDPHKWISNNMNLNKCDICNSYIIISGLQCSIYLQNEYS